MCIKQHRSYKNKAAVLKKCTVHTRVHRHRHDALTLAGVEVALGGLGTPGEGPREGESPWRVQVPRGRESLRHREGKSRAVRASAAAVVGLALHVRGSAGCREGEAGENMDQRLWKEVRPPREE